MTEYPTSTLPVPDATEASVAAEHEFASAADAPTVAIPVPPVPPVPPTPPTPRSSIVLPPPAPRKTVSKPILAAAVAGALLVGGIAGGAIIGANDNESKGSGSQKSGSAVVATTAVSAGSNSNTNNSLAKPRIAGTTDIKTILTEVEPGVVSVTTRGFNPIDFFGDVPQSGAGTGMVISADGYILTNNHVIDNATSIKVTFADRKVRTARLIGSVPDADVAIIKVDKVKDLATVTLGKSGDLEVGDDVVAIGNALALPGGPTVTTGIVSALDRKIDDPTGTTLEGLIQTDAAINPGNSGGPLVNSNGEVVGMNTAIINGSNNIGFAIAIDRAKPIIDDIRNGKTGKGSVRSGTFLGVTSQTMNQELKDRYDLPVASGVLIIEVVTGSPAENAGLRPGDIVTAFEAKKVTTSDALVAAVRNRKDGDVVAIEWRRGDTTEKRTVTLGSRGILVR